MSRTITTGRSRFPLALIAAAAVQLGACADGRAAAGNNARPAAGELAQQPDVRRVWVGTNELDHFGSTPSPDARYLPATDWNSGHLVLHDFAGDSLITLTGDRAVPLWPEYAYGAAISADGAVIAYQWVTVGTGSARPDAELRVMPWPGRDAAQSQVIYRNPDADWILPFAFTPDGLQVVAVIALRDGTHRIAAVPAAGGETRVLRSFGARYPRHLAVSADGQWIAYDAPASARNSASDVHLLSVDGSRHITLLASGDHEFVIGWTPDGGHLMYGVEEGGAAVIYAVPVSDGRSRGAPVVVRRDLWRMLPVGTAAHGGFVYMVLTGTRDLVAAVIDPATGDITSEPVSVTGSDAAALPFAVEFSPDAQHVAYLASRGAMLSGARDLVIRGTERGEVRRLPLNGFRVSSMRWAPDGRSLVVHGSDDSGQPGIGRVDLQSGELSQLHHVERGSVVHWTMSPDGAEAIIAGPIGDRMTLRGMDLGSGSVRVLHTAADPTSYPGGIEVSPDGRAVAYLDRSSRTAPAYITLIATATGEAHEIYRLPEGRYASAIGGLAWSPDGRFIYFALEADAGAEVWRLDVTTRTAHHTGVSAANVGRLRISRDGRRLGFAINDLVHEIWIMDAPQLDGAAAGQGTTGRR
jgi:Tol biopolymer transport system component